MGERDLGGIDIQSRVIPANAGIQPLRELKSLGKLDPRFRGGDGKGKGWIQPRAGGPRRSDRRLRPAQEGRGWMPHRPKAASPRTKNGAGVATGPVIGFRPGSCDPGRFPIGRPLKQAPTGFPISGPIEASSERSLCGSFARRLRFRRTPGKVGSDLGRPASSRFFPGCPTTASMASIPKDIRRFRGGGTQKLSSVSGRPLLTAKCQYGQAFRFAEADSACG